jgi:hypothetical protein
VAVNTAVKLLVAVGVAVNVEEDVFVTVALGVKV